MYLWGNFFCDHGDLGVLLPQDTSHLHNLKGIKHWVFIRHTVPTYPIFKLIYVANSTFYMDGAFYPFQIIPSALSRYQLSKVRSLRLREDSTLHMPLRVSDWKALLGLVPELRELSIEAAGAPQCTRAVVSALRPPKLFPPSIPTLDRVICPTLKMINMREEMDLPFLSICSLSEERISYGAPEIHFKFHNSSAPRNRAAPVMYGNVSDSGSEIDQGFDALGPGAHVPRVEYIKFEEPREKPLAWPTQPYLWTHYVDLGNLFVL
ncbi:F-box domain-containing protein [Mycena sanguinolenta]|uniref:F-box domain-containing protein n=1 Tax=Mycena sanguinolenta TaxID=230812 RepID=A0A8H7DJV8_9AGAR|nr:F-box domain-containing protein [Mycena sanguinolenta]